MSSTQKQIAWQAYKDERRNAARLDRMVKKRKIEDLKKMMAEAAATGKVLVRKKIQPYRKYPKVPGGRATSRNAERKARRVTRALDRARKLKDAA